MHLDGGLLGFEDIPWVWRCLGQENFLFVSRFLWGMQKRFKGMLLFFVSYAFSLPFTDPRTRQLPTIITAVNSNNLRAMLFEAYIIIWSSRLKVIIGICQKKPLAYAPKHSIEDKFKEAHFLADIHRHRHWSYFANSSPVSKWAQSSQGSVIQRNNCCCGFASSVTGFSFPVIKF